MAKTMFDLSGKTAVITGAGRGLGLAISVALAEAGADIIGIQRSSMDQAATAVQNTGRKFHAITADIGDKKTAIDIIPDIISDNGNIDILVNNAGIIRRQDSLDLEPDNWYDVLNVNLSSAMWLSQGAARHWVANNRGGKIINIASMLSFQGGIRVAGYTASKSGLAGLTKILANEWASKSINVNAIAPGYFATDNTRQLRDDEQRNAEILSRIPAGRWGVPSELGGAAIFLASAASDYIHGTILPVDGGWLAR